MVDRIFDILTVVGSLLVVAGIVLDGPWFFISGVSIFLASAFGLYWIDTTKVFKDDSTDEVDVDGSEELEEVK